jgi:hypothetical protein
MLETYTRHARHHGLRGCADAQTLADAGKLPDPTLYSGGPIALCRQCADIVEEDGGVIKGCNSGYPLDPTHACYRSLIPQATRSWGAATAHVPPAKRTQFLERVLRHAADARPCSDDDVASVTALALTDWHQPADDGLEKAPAFWQDWRRIKTTDVMTPTIVPGRHHANSRVVIPSCG